MNFNFSAKTRILFSSLILAVVLFLALFYGIRAGKTQAQAQAIFQTAENLALALKYSYSDQNRYPSALEFGKQDIMLNYLTIFPLPEFSGKSCAQNFVYKRLNQNNYELNFCLPAPVSDYRIGWNKISSQSFSAD